VKDAISKKKAGGMQHATGEKDTHIQDYRRRILSEFFKKIPTQRCETCKG